MNIISFSKIPSKLADFFTNRKDTFNLITDKIEDNSSKIKPDLFLSFDNLSSEQIEIVKKYPKSSIIVQGLTDDNIQQQLSNVMFMHDEKSILHHLSLLDKLEWERDNKRILYEIYCDINKADNIEDIIRLLFTKMDKFVDFDVISILRTTPQMRLNIASRFVLNENEISKFVSRILSNYRMLCELKLNVSDFIIDNELYEDTKDFSEEKMFFVGIPIISNYKILGFVEIGREKQFSEENYKNLHTIITIFSLPVGNFLFIQNMKMGNKRMVELNELRARFLDICSHELRTPISAIDGFVEIFMDGILGDLTQKQREIMVRIKDNTERLVRLTSDLLDLSKIERDELVLRVYPCDIKEIIDIVLVTLSIEFTKKNIEFDKTFSTDLPVIYADRDKLIQVLTNILSNCLKYSNATKITIIAEHLKRSSESIHSSINGIIKKEYVKVSVIDNGIGIPEQGQHKIFEKFFQINTKLSSLTGGVGLGLYICKKIIETHNGKIWAEPGKEGGTNFSFTLPVDGRTFEYFDFIKKLNTLTINSGDIKAVLLTSKVFKELKNSLVYERYESLIDEIQNLVVLKVLNDKKIFRVDDSIFGVIMGKSSDKGAEWLAKEIVSIVSVADFLINDKSFKIDFDYKIVNISSHSDNIEQVVANGIMELVK